MSVIEQSAWPDPAKYASGRAECAALVERVRATGFVVSEHENGFSVARAITDVRLAAPATTRAGKQVGVFTTDSDGAFRWGWVTYPTEDGITQYYNERQFIRNLNDLKEHQ